MRWLDRGFPFWLRQNLGCRLLPGLHINKLWVLWCVMSSDTLLIKGNNYLSNHCASKAPNQGKYINCLVRPTGQLLTQVMQLGEKPDLQKEGRVTNKLCAEGNTSEA